MMVNMKRLTEEQEAWLRGAGWDRYVGRGLGLWCEVKAQRLWLVGEGCVHGEYECSTAGAGVGEQNGSYQTPRGWHEIDEMIGGGMPIGAVFESREWTGRVWPMDYQKMNHEPSSEDTEGVSGEDLICTRIMWLRGLEAGLNAGNGVDTHERYIYIHGTNHEDRLGVACSHGCVRVSNADALALFGQVKSGTRIWIDAGE